MTQLSGKSSRARARGEGKRAKPRRGNFVNHSTRNRIVVAAIILLGGGTAFVVISKFISPNGLQPIILTNRSEIDPDVLKLIDEQVTLVQADTASAERHGELGIAYEVNDLFELAMQCFQNAESLAPDVPVWPYRRSICLIKVTRGAEADQVLRDTMSRFPSFAPAPHQMGELSLTRDDLQYATKCFQRTIELMPTFAGGYIGMAEVQVRRKQYAEAKASVEKALTIDPNARGARYVLGLAYRGLGDLDRAKIEMTLGSGSGRQFIGDRLTPVMQRFSVNVRTVVENAHRLRKEGRIREAAAILEASLQRQPNEYLFLNNLAAVYVDLEQFAKAQELLKRATQIDPNNFGAYINLATCHLHLAETNDAFSAADRAVEIAPNVSTTHLVKADVLVFARRYDEAMECLRTAAKLNAGDPEIPFKQGDIFLKQRRFEEARTMFEHCIKLSPLHVGAHVNRSASALFAGRIDEAKQSLAEAENIDPRNPRVKLLREQIARAENAE